MEKAGGGEVLKEGARKSDPEVPEKAQRRRFTAEYKLRILREADTIACEDTRHTGRLLQHHGMDVFEPVAARIALADLGRLDDLAEALFVI